MKQRCLSLLIALILVLSLAACAGNTGAEGESVASGADSPVAWEPEERDEDDANDVNDDADGAAAEGSASGSRSAADRRSETAKTDPASPVGVARRFTDAFLDWDLREAAQYALKEDVEDILFMEEEMKVFGEEEQMMFDLILICFDKGDYRVVGDTVAGDTAEVSLVLTAIDGEAVSDEFAATAVRYFEENGIDVTASYLWEMGEHLYPLLIDFLSQPDIPTHEVEISVYLERENGRWAVDYDEFEDILDELVMGVEYMIAAVGMY